MRKALVNGLERAMSAGQSVQRDRRGGQLALFADPKESPETPRAAPKLSADEWTEAEMLAREKQVLGFYITRHPLTHHEALIEACATTSTVGLAKFKDGDNVILGGMVTQVRAVTARSGRSPGRKMGIVTIEDLKGRVDVIVFPEDLVKYRPLLVPDAVVFLEGAVDGKREEPSLRVSRVIPAAEAVAELTKSLVVTLGPTADVSELPRVLRSSPGHCPVYVNVTMEDGYTVQVQCSAALRVKCSESLLSPLVGILGREKVVLLGPNRRPIPFGLAAAPAGQRWLPMAETG
jgi:DNA polymerase-3 subunit alpha